ncbi:NAD(P)-binding protein [Canariomyces notabilis]|uniref:NAD(P)-binding protein n=1 Tax=Canariomyces notabilis TaxID=2074819 RepID=A0AAN6YSR9_9PEZI|nr:NAD(P)-binding protein [Canariomyces arenarius]
MPSESPFRKVLLIGATGSIGSVILRALLAEPTLSVTILRRESSSSSTNPPNVTTITVPDTYPTASLIPAFTGQDAIISCLTTLSTRDQLRFISAAISAGVRRYLPSEYGLNNMRADAQSLCPPVFGAKGAVQAHLREAADKGLIEWTSISCGMWIGWSMRNNFLGMRVRDKKFEMWDEGEGRFSVTTEENTALAVVNALVKIPEETKNTNVMISEMVVTQKELLAEIERQTGNKFVVERVNSYKKIPELQAAYAGGDVAAAYGLIEAGFVTGRYGGDLEKEGELFNDRLGLKGHTLQEVVADALASL